MPAVQPSLDRINGLSSGLAIKAPCRTATTANITLSGLQTLDGITVVADDRVLVKNQTDQTENGIYYASSSTWERAQDFDGNRDVAKGTLVRVTSGTIASTNLYYELTTANPIVIGTSNLTFSAISYGSGSMANQNASSVTITGGSITGITDLAIADGGTGASNASDARTNLGLAIGTNVQAYDAGLLSIAGLTTAADKMIYTTASDTYATADLSSFARTLLDDANAAAARATLGATSGFTTNSSVATTSGTSVSSSGTVTIPSTATQIRVTFNGVSTNGTSIPLIQLGDSGGLESSGYTQRGGYSTAGSNSTAGFAVADNWAATNTINGEIIFTLVATNTWSGVGIFADIAGNKMTHCAGIKTTSGTLDRVGITTVAGTDTFDAGLFYVTYM
jgi:hypothetical protein